MASDEKKEDSGIAVVDSPDFDKDARPPSEASLGPNYYTDEDHYGLEIPTDVDRETLRRVPEGLTWAAYCLSLCLLDICVCLCAYL